MRPALRINFIVLMLLAQIRRIYFSLLSELDEKPGHNGTSMKLYLIFGFICLVAAVLLSCIAGVYAATNALAALAIAFTACLALFIGVRWVSDRR